MSKQTEATVYRCADPLDAGDRMRVDFRDEVAVFDFFGTAPIALSAQDAVDLARRLTERFKGAKK